MRTRIESGALSSLEGAELKAIEGGVTLAFDSRTGSVLSKYTDQFADRLPGPVIGPDRLANIGDPLAK